MQFFSRRGDIFIPILIAVGLVALAGGSFIYKYNHPVLPEKATDTPPPAVPPANATPAEHQTSTLASSSVPSTIPPTAPPSRDSVHPKAVPPPVLTSTTASSSGLLPPKAASTTTVLPPATTTPTSTVPAASSSVGGGQDPVIPQDVQDCVSEIENSNIPEDQIDAVMAQCLESIRQFEASGQLQGYLRAKSPLTANLVSSFAGVWRWITR